MSRRSLHFKREYGKADVVETRAAIVANKSKPAGRRRFVENKNDRFGDGINRQLVEDSTKVMSFEKANRIAQAIHAHRN